MSAPPVDPAVGPPPSAEMRTCVVMCTYNGERYLREQLASIAAQTRPPHSMVIVDDASHDASLEIARAFAATAPFPVRVERNEANLGYAQNFARAIALAEGDVIVLADQDDVWRGDKLARMEAEFARDASVGMVFSDAEVVDAQLRPLGFRLWSAVGLDAARLRCFGSGRELQVLLRAAVVTGATMGFRTGLRAAVLPIPEGLFHDAWIAAVAAATARTAAIPEPLVLYRQHGGNTIGASRLTLWRRLRVSRQNRVAELDRLRRQNEALLQRLRALGVERPHQVAALQDAIAHLRVRTTLPSGLPRRMRPITAEVLSGRYARHSRGLSTALRDLIA
ncbi:MAG TPA: glycosyltransferase family 2 protein [Longimicrobiaceae bacterium]|nr:glycosyltransferase family 2 protein [Longimicrobiaceae bacterium]